jgi:hypothetical protein
MSTPIRSNVRVEPTISKSKSIPTRVTLILPEKVDKSLAIYSVLNDQTKSETVTQAIKEYLTRRGFDMDEFTKLTS